MLVQACWVGCTGVRVIDCPCSRAKHGAAAFHDFFGFFLLFKITRTERSLAPVLRFVLGKLGRFFSRGVM